MKSQLRVLIVADPASDAELLIRELRRGGYEPCLERAETLDAIDAALGKHNWDVVFADNPMPRFNLAEALALIRDRDPEVPVIILTSRIAEEEAAAAMKAGADDYIVKDNLLRLVPAVARELRDAEAHRARKRAEDQLVESENHLRTIIGSEPECVKLLAADGTLLQMNPAGLAMTGADSAEQVLGQSVYPIIAPEHRSAFKALNERVFRGESGILQFEIEGLKGTRRWLETHAVPLRNSDDDIVAQLSITRDITLHKRTEEALRLSEERCRTLVEHAPEAIVVLDVIAGRFIDGNENAARLFGVT
ncbi:MAG TPA: PAS domain S-box protein, partial [Blastocatellia bacterium]|nr:PAS domain S-box protein [Blastocatellia bacterium]